MRIAIISKSDRIGGGASRFAEDLTNWFNQEGYYTDHYIAFPNKKTYPFQKSLYGEGFTNKICKSIHRFTNRFGFREIIPVEYIFNLTKILDGYDLIHFHDLYSSISPFTLALVSRRKPTFFTIHDCSAFTGGCLYPTTCSKFLTKCYSCPQLPQDNWIDRLKDRSGQIQLIKKMLSSKFHVQYIFPSKWIFNQASLSLNFKIGPVHIPYGIEMDNNYVNNKIELRSIFKIDMNRKVIVVSAHNLFDTRKGIKYAISALQSIKNLNPLALIVGHSNKEIIKGLVNIEYRELGYIEDRQQLAQIYQVSDLLLFTSLADNLPFTILENMAVSTPAIAFSVGGVGELINNGRNGILVEPANQKSLNHNLYKALVTMNLKQMGLQAKLDIKRRYSKDICIKRHIDLYKSSIDNMEYRLNNN